MTLLIRMFVVWVAVGNAALARAQPVELDAALNETVEMVPRKVGPFTMDLETTLYKPEGDGPFPIAVINHGKSLGNPRFQNRSRPAHAARYFLQRGYAVVVPMRQGFSRSGGNYMSVGCNVESNGRVQADDVKSVLDWVVAQPWADKDRIVMLGQSHGGWTTLAFGTMDYPGLKGLVNFAGGLRTDQCIDWQGNLATGAGNYGRETRLPSIWFYGDNDSYFDSQTSQAMLDKYASAGGNARMIAFGKFGSDAHSMFGARAGRAIWQPEVGRFLAAIGMPHEPLPAYAKYGGTPPMPAPPRTDFAAVDEEGKVPFLRETGRTGYRNYLTKEIPRAFAIAPNGSWALATGGDDPLTRALNHCSRLAKSECRLYSVDDHVVWKE